MDAEPLRRPPGQEGGNCLPVVDSGPEALRPVDIPSSFVPQGAASQEDVYRPIWGLRVSMTRDITLKLIALLCIVFVTTALFLMHRSPAVGYELSIYASTPVLVWYLLFLSLVGGIGIVIHELATGRFQERRTYLLGFAVILLTAVCFLCLPFVRNYVTWRGDQMGHIGFVEDIALTGHVPGFNPYPITHTLLYQIVLVTGSPIARVVNLNTALIFPVFVLSTYLLATAVLPHRGQQLLAALVAGGTLAALSRFNLIPNTWSMLLLPLLFYCYFNRGRFPFKVLLILLLIAYPFIHPLSSLMIIGALAVMELPKPLYSRLLKRYRLQTPSWVGSRPVLWPLFLELTVSVPWVFTREWFRSNIDALWYQLTTFSGSQQGQEMGEKLGKVDLDIIGIIGIAVKLYGELLLFGILACLGILLLIKQLRSGKGNTSSFRLLLVGILFLLTSLFYVAFLIGIPGAEAISAPRLLVYVEIACITLMAFALWDIPSRARFRHAAWVAVSGLIIVAAVLNVAAHHASPYQIRPGEQITQADMDGMTWFLEEKDPLIYSYYIMSPADRFSQAILGTTTTNSRQDVKYVDLVQFEDHFGYLNPDGSDNYTTLGEQYSVDIYGSINKFDKVAYQTVWHNLDRFNDNDFWMLDQDPAVDRIYSNGATECLFITSHKPRDSS